MRQKLVFFYVISVLVGMTGLADVPAGSGTGPAKIDRAFVDQAFCRFDTEAFGYKGLQSLFSEVCGAIEMDFGTLEFSDSVDLTDQSSGDWPGTLGITGLETLELAANLHKLSIVFISSDQQFMIYDSTCEKREQYWYSKVALSRLLKNSPDTEQPFVSKLREFFASSQALFQVRRESAA